MSEDVNRAYFRPPGTKIQIKRCPYCGSIEITGNQCKWCHNTIPEEVIKSERLENKEP